MVWFVLEGSESITANMHIAQQSVYQGTNYELLGHRNANLRNFLIFVRSLAVCSPPPLGSLTRMLRQSSMLVSLCVLTRSRCP